jgi:histidine triad (HIT) family protein
MATVQRVSGAVKQAFSAPGIMIAQLNGPAAGQTVFHLHFHIMPRYEGLEMGMHAREMADFAVLNEHAERIREQLAQSATG